jgi:hypothetical protein
LVRTWEAYERAKRSYNPNLRTPRILITRMKHTNAAGMVQEGINSAYQEPQPLASVEQVAPPQPTEPAPQRPRLTQVDTRETPTNRGFSMYPSRHRQVAKDLAYIEDRNPWQIIEDALEEFVVRHYGKENKRKEK